MPPAPRDFGCILTFHRCLQMMHLLELTNSRGFPMVDHAVGLKNPTGNLQKTESFYKSEHKG
jgi:hypothetical protein